LASAGSVTLNIDERLKLQLALDELSVAITFENIQLWGKINGKHSLSLEQVSSELHLLTLRLQVWTATTTSLLAATISAMLASHNAASSGAPTTTIPSVSCLLRVFTQRPSSNSCNSCSKANTPT
jgi:hypothetical protein